MTALRTRLGAEPDTEAATETECLTLSECIARGNVLVRVQIAAGDALAEPCILVQSAPVASPDNSSKLSYPRIDRQRRVFGHVGDH